MSHWRSARGERPSRRRACLLSLATYRLHPPVLGAGLATTARFFFLATSYLGNVVTGTNPEFGMLDTAHDIKDVRFVHRSQIEGICQVAPDVLKTSFWDDLADGFPSTPLPRCDEVRPSQDTWKD